jgi:hypothetical protein
MTAVILRVLDGRCFVVWEGECNPISLDENGSAVGCSDRVPLCDTGVGVRSLP